jgi:dihydroorotase
MSSNTRLLIKQAQILLPDGSFLRGDTSIVNGKISEVAPEISPRDTDKIVDATGLVLLPG